MTEFLFVRHAESLTNCQPEIIAGRSHSAALSTRGEQQAALLGAYLREAYDELAHVYSSGAVRTDATARIALHAAGYTQRPTVDERLLEVSQGDYEGRVRSEVYSPEAIERY